MRALPTLVLLAGLTAACGGPAPAVSHYTRSEKWTDERTSWLHENCQFVGVLSTVHPGTAGGGQVLAMSYLQILGSDTTQHSAQWRHLAYACRQAPPWARADGELVAEVYRHVRDGDLARCGKDGRPANAVTAMPAPPAGKVEIVSEGAGSRPTEDSFVRVRVRPLGPDVPGKEPAAGAKETHPPIAFEHTPRERVAHMSCLPGLSPALLKLRLKGKATVGEWEVELLELGDEGLLKRELGLEG